MAKVTAKIPKDILLDILDGEEDGRIQNKFAYQGRWSTTFEMVFRYDGKIYSVLYSEGSTENQDERPFEYDDDYVECTEVYPVETVTTVYKPVVVASNSAS